MSEHSYEVKKIQRALNEHGFALRVDGNLGAKTEKAIETFQRQNGLYADGVVGPLTGKILFSYPETYVDVKKRLKFEKISCDKHGKGASVTYLREDAAADFRKVIEEAHEAGAIITSSGGRRLLTASVGPNRSQTSLHYLGLAHDLFIWSAMMDPHTDPYVVEHIGNRQWMVYARCTGHGPLVEEKKIKAYTYDNKEVEVEGTFLNVSGVFAKHGFQPIKARRSFFTRRNKLGAEYWHFQYEKALTPGARFGDELLKSFRLKKLQAYALWNRRNVQWKTSWF